MALISILLAFIGYSILNIAQAGQKIGLSMMPESRVKGLAIWIIATLATSVSFFIVLYAVSVGNVSQVGAMAGSGLVSLALFSALVMKEKIGKRDVLGIIIVLAGAALIGAFARESEPAQILLYILYIFLAIVSLLYILSLVTVRKKISIMGILIGGFAGALGGFVLLFQKISTSEIGRAGSLVGESSKIGETLTNPYALIWILLSIVSMAVLQFAYKRDTAIRIIPAFMANLILVPVLGGVICFQEKLSYPQWLGVILILAGMFFLTVKPKKKRLESAPR